MLEKPLFYVVFLLISTSLCIESVKMGGNSVMLADHSLANIASRNGLTKDSVCFPGFAEDQGITVQRLGEEREGCVNSEARASAKLAEELSQFSYDMAKIADAFCVKIDSECRDQFAQDGDIQAALDCYANLPLEGRKAVINIAEQCTMKLLTNEHENRSIVTTKKNCTSNANFEYLRTSDSLFDQFLKCEKLPSDGSTTVSTTDSTTESTTESTTVSTTPPSTETDSTTLSPEVTTESDPTTESVVTEASRKKQLFQRKIPV